MHKVKAMAAIGAFVAAASGVGASTAATTPPAPTPNPCPSGMVCIYQGLTVTTPIQRGYYRLGPTRVTLKGKHLVVNQLWDARTVFLRTHADGTGTAIATIKRSEKREVVDMTRVRSVFIQRSCPTRHCFTTIPQ